MFKYVRICTHSLCHIIYRWYLRICRFTYIRMFTWIELLFAISFSSILIIEPFTLNSIYGSPNYYSVLSRVFQQTLFHCSYYLVASPLWERKQVELKLNIIEPILFCNISLNVRTWHYVCSLLGGQDWMWRKGNSVRFH